MAEDYKSYYDQIAPNFDCLRLDRTNEIETTLRIIRQFVEPKDGFVLDIGCGTGRYASPLSKSGYVVVGIDKSINQLRHAKNIPLTACASAENLPFGDNLFSACLVILVLHQLDRHARTALFREANRTLKGEGKVILKTCSHKDLSKRPFTSYFPSGLKINLTRYPDISELAEGMKSGGFHNVQVLHTYSEEILDKQDVLSSIRQKHNTTLALIPTLEFEEGCVEMERAFAKEDEICVPHHHTIVIADK